MNKSLLIKENNHSYNLLFVQKYILIFLPIALVTGPFLSELICIISTLIFMISSVSNKEWKYYKNIFFYIILIWSSILIVSSLLSQNILLSLESSLLYWRHGLFAISVWYLIDKDRDFLKLFLYSFLIVFLFLIIDGFYQYFNGENLLGFPYNPNKARLSSLFGDEWIFGNYLSRLMPLLFALTLFVTKKPKKYLLLLCFFVIASDILIYLSGERVAFFNLILSTVLMILLMNKYKKFRLFTFIISLSIIAFLTLSNNKIKSRMIDNTFNQLNILGSEYVADHELFIISSVKMFQDKPILGFGPKMYREICSDTKYFLSNELWNSCSTHPHNTYLQLISETGILGFIFIFGIFLFVSYLFFKQFFSKIFSKEFRLSDVQICLYIAIFISLFPLATSLNFFNNWINIIYYLPLGFLISTYYVDKEE